MNIVTNPEVFYPVGSEIITQPNEEDCKNWQQGGFTECIGAKGTITRWSTNHLGEPLAFVEWLNGMKSWVRPMDIKPITAAQSDDEYDPIKQLESAKKRTDDNLREIFGY